MRTWRIIKGIAITVGLFTAIALANHTDASGKESWAAFVVAVLALICAINDQLCNELKKEGK